MPTLVMNETARRELRALSMREGMTGTWKGQTYTEVCYET